MFERVTRERIPASFTALELSRQAERVAAAVGPLLLSGSSRIERMKIDREIRVELVQLETLLAQVNKDCPEWSKYIEQIRAVK